MIYFFYSPIFGFRSNNNSPSLRNNMMDVQVELKKLNDRIVSEYRKNEARFGDIENRLVDIKQIDDTEGEWMKKLETEFQSLSERIDDVAFRMETTFKRQEEAEADVRDQRGGGEDGSYAAVAAAKSDPEEAFVRKANDLLDHFRDLDEERQEIVERLQRTTDGDDDVALEKRVREAETAIGEAVQLMLSYVSTTDKNDVISSLRDVHSEAFSDWMRNEKLPTSLRCQDERHPKEDTKGRRLIFGLGTGRSGTKSLRYLLNAQISSNVTHEAPLNIPNAEHFQPWTPRKGSNRFYLARRRVKGIVRNSAPHQLFVGDVHSVHLPYVEEYLCIVPDAKFVALERPKEDVVRSFMKWTARDAFVDKSGKPYSYNHFQPPEEKTDPGVRPSIYDVHFPKYSGLGSKAAAIGAYWDEYHDTLVKLQREYPDNVRVFDMSQVMSNRGGVQRDLLRFVGYPDKAIRTNAWKPLNSAEYKRAADVQKKGAVSNRLAGGADRGPVGA